MGFKFTRLNIPEVVLIDAQPIEDHRGFLVETFKASDFERCGISTDFVQENHSVSRLSVIRGLHYQLCPMQQGKLVRVIRGELFDVAVDIRINSPTYEQWTGVPLSSKRHQAIWVPPGFAHGTCSLTDRTEVVYMLTREYNPQSERGFAWNDPNLDIHWPVKDPILSEKDRFLPQFGEVENNLYWHGSEVATFIG